MLKPTGSSSTGAATKSMRLGAKKVETKFDDWGDDWENEQEEEEEYDPSPVHVRGVKAQWTHGLRCTRPITAQVAPPGRSRLAYDDEERSSSVSQPRYDHSSLIVVHVLSGFPCSPARFGLRVCVVAAFNANKYCLQFQEELRSNRSSKPAFTSHPFFTCRYYCSLCVDHLFFIQVLQ